MSKVRIIFLSLFIVFLGLFFVCAGYLFFLTQILPPIDSLKDYNPPLISTALDRKGRKLGEFFTQRRKLVSYSQFPPVLINAFISSEDGRFFEHKGLNIKAILRAFIANLKAGRKVQGGSTITQQVARSLLLSSKKTYTRKFKEAILALRIEKNLSKQEILYLYLNQIYLGHGAYGVGMAAENYFRKNVKDLNLAESSLLAGLPQAPSRFSPVYYPKKAKERQVYVLHRMTEENYINKQQADTIINTPLKVFLREKYHKKAPYYLETLRQSVLQKLDESLLLKGGLTIKTAMDLFFQQKAQKHLKAGLKKIDKRQGYRGSLAQLEEAEINSFFTKEEEEIIEKRREFRVILPFSSEDLTLVEDKKLTGIKIGETFKAVVKLVNDDLKKVVVILPFKTLGIISLEDMEWARVPNPKVSFKFSKIKYPSLVLKKGDVILVKVKEKLNSEMPFFKEFIKKPEHLLISKEDQKIYTKIFTLSLEQEPLVEGALIAFDQKTGDILALVGGYDFDRSQFNRTYQAARQTGSVFKPLVYLSALDKGYTPSTLITDAPLVYKETEAEGGLKQARKKIKNIAQNNPLAEGEQQEKQEEKVWKPHNYGRHFSGDVLFRNGLIRSMNVPTVKLIEDLGIQWVHDYSRRLGIFSTLNLDYTLALGSSSVTLYEMTKVFSVLGRLGKKITPLIVYEILNKNQEKILDSISLDERFTEQTRSWDEKIKEDELLLLKKQITGDTDNGDSINNKKSPNFFFSQSDQLISKKTAYIMTTLLKSVIQEPGGTGGGARSMEWPLAGKTGTTNGYFDAWFIGYSPEIAVGVWVGFDNEKSLGVGETGSRAALPIWLEFMKDVHVGLEKSDFKIPEGIVFTYIDNKTGKLVSPRSHKIVQQAFIKGTQPKQITEIQNEADQNFLRESYSQ